MNKKNKKSYSNPYLAGVFLGMVLLASFIFLGAGLGASSGMARIGAFLEGLILSDHTFTSEYFGKWGETPLNYYLVYMFIEIFLGGFVSAFISRRIELKVEKSNSFSIKKRIIFSLTGGILIGFASRLAGGCTSGQALTGGVLLLNGSLIFLVCLFAGGFSAAYLVRRQWHD